MESDWKDDYSVGNATLDKQHRAFFALCRLAAECRQDISREGVEKFHTLLNDLMDFARRHFVTEEGILQNCGYPHLAQQKSEHLEYEERLTQVVLDATFGELDRDGLYHYLTEWWVDHILNSDMKYREFLSASLSA